MRSLVVYHNGTTVGVLSEQENIWEFSYADDWLSFVGGLDLSSALSRDGKTITDGSSTRPVQWYFDNLLPEETLRQVQGGPTQCDIRIAPGCSEHPSILQCRLCPDAP